MRCSAAESRDGLALFLGLLRNPNFRVMWFLTVQLTILAKAALRDLAGKDTETPRSHASLARLARQRRQDLVEEWWSQNAPDAYRALGLMMRRRKPPELRLPRKLLHKLLAARTGHGDFAAYHRRFNHPDANLLCHCGQEKSPIHFLRCRASPTARANSHRALSSLIESHLV